MIQRIAVISALSLSACAQGPTLGKATDVVITARTNSVEPGAKTCQLFNPTVAQVTKFLNSVIILNPYEAHYQFYFGPCKVEGTAKFRGQDATWSMNDMGTGGIVILSEDGYTIGLEKSRDTCDDC